MQKEHSTGADETAEVVRWKKLHAKLYAVGQYVWVFQNLIPPKGTKKQLKNWRGPFMIKEMHQQD